MSINIVAPKNVRMPIPGLLAMNLKNSPMSSNKYPAIF